MNIVARYHEAVRRYDKEQSEENKLELERLFREYRRTTIENVAKAENQEE